MDSDNSMPEDLIDDNPETQKVKSRPPLEIQLPTEAPMIMCCVSIGGNCITSEEDAPPTITFNILQR